MALPEQFCDKCGALLVQKYGASAIIGQLCAYGEGER